MFASQHSAQLGNICPILCFMSLSGFLLSEDLDILGTIQADVLCDKMFCLPSKVWSRKQLELAKAWAMLQGADTHKGATEYLQRYTRCL